MGKKYRNSSVPRNKRVYDDTNKTMIDTGIPNLNGVREYTMPVPNALEKTTVCKYCAKNLVRGYICRDCRELEQLPKQKSFEERQAIEEGLALLQQIRSAEAVIKADDKENAISYKQAEAIVEHYCRGCGMYIPQDVSVNKYKLKCDFCK